MVRKQAVPARRRISILTKISVASAWQPPRSEPISEPQGKRPGDQMAPPAGALWPGSAQAADTGGAQRRTRGWQLIVAVEPPWRALRSWISWRR